MSRSASTPPRAPRPGGFETESVQDQKRLSALVAALDQLTVAIVELDGRGCLRHINAAAATHLGAADLTAWLGRPWLECVEPAQRMQAAALLTAVPGGAHTVQLPSASGEALVWRVAAGVGEAGADGRLLMGDLAPVQPAADALQAERYQQITAMAEDTVFAFALAPDGTLRPEWVTGAFTRRSGHPLEALQDLDHLNRIVFPDDRPLLQQQIERVLAGQPVEFDLRIVTASGPIRWARVRAWPRLGGPAGPVTGFSGTAHDITDQRQSEALLHRYRLLAEHARDGILIVRASDGRILEANAAAQQAYGYSAAEMLALTIDDLRAPAARAAIAEQLQRAGADGLTFEASHRRRDGQVFPVEVSARSIAIDGEPVSLNLVRDITARRQAEAARRASEEHFQQIAELAVDYAYALRFRPDGGYELEWDAGRLAAVPNYNFRDTQGQAAWQALVHPDDFPAMLAQQRRLLAGETVDFVVRVGGPDGRLHWLQHYGRPRVADGRVVGYVGAVRDVTARHAAEAALRVSEERYRLISELSSDYAFANRIAPDGSIVREWITDAFTRITGYPPGDVISLEDWRRIVNAQDWPLVVKVFREAVQGGTATADYRITTASGEERWLRVRARGFPETGRTVGAVSDVTEQKRAEQELRAHARRLALLRDLSRSILAARAPAEIANSALLHLNALVPAAGWSLWVRGQAGGPPVLLAGLGLPLTEPPPAVQPPDPGRQRADRAGAFGPWQALSGETLPAALCVPLRAAGQDLGLLVAADPAPNRFTDSDLELAEEVTDEVAIAVHQRHLQESESQRRLELEALAEVSAALRQATSITGVQQILTEQLAAVVHAQGGALFVQDDGWVLAAAIGPVVIPVGTHLAPELAARLTRQMRDDVAGAFWSEDAPILASLRVLTLPDLPVSTLLQLRGADRLPAAVLLAWSAPHPVTALEGQLLTAIAEVGSNALQRSNLLDTLERRVAERTRELTSLYEVAAVANQAAPASARLERALALTLQAVGAEGGAVYEAAEDGQHLALLAHQGLAPAILDQLSGLTVQASLTGQVLRTGESLIVNDLTAARPIPPEMEPWARTRWRYIGLPLASRGQVLGVLGLVGRSEAHLSAESISLLSTIADQLGTLLEAERLRQQAERTAVAEERQRLARDLHDSVTQSLYSALLFAAAAQEQIGLDAADRARGYLGRIDAILGQALREMRLLIYELRPAMLEALGLARALQHRLDAVEGHANVRAQLQVDGDCRLPPAEEETLYAVAQEALNNALKHAAARSVQVTLRGAPERVTLEVEDDGRGFDLAAAGERGGAGLGNMRERLARRGGQLQIESRPGHGTRVTAEVKR